MKTTPNDGSCVKSRASNGHSPDMRWRELLRLPDVLDFLVAQWLAKLPQRECAVLLLEALCTWKADIVFEQTSTGAVLLNLFNSAHADARRHRFFALELERRTLPTPLVDALGHGDLLHAQHFEKTYVAPVIMGNDHIVYSHYRHPIALPRTELLRRALPALFERELDANRDPVPLCKRLVTEAIGWSDRIVTDDVRCALVDGIRTLSDLLQQLRRRRHPAQTPHATAV